MLLNPLTVSVIIIARKIFFPKINICESYFCFKKKKFLSIQVVENENSKYWLSVLNELKNRGVKDILILCSDVLTGIREAITTAFPMTE